MKAVLVRSTLDDIAKDDPELATRMRARMSAAALEQLHDASRVGFVPIGVDVELTEALFAEAGPVLAAETLRSGIAGSLSGPLFGSMIATARAVLGGSLASLLKWSPRVWAAIYRDAGVVVVEETSSTRARLAIEDLPLSVCESPSYLRGTAAAIGGIFDIVGTEGRVELEGPDVDRRRAVFHLHWRLSSHD